MKVEVVLNTDKNIVLLNDEELTFEVLQKLAKNVIENSEDLDVNFEGFDDQDEIKEYYNQLLKGINDLKNDSEICETVEKISKFEKSDGQ